jgi:hypothetical protein
VLPCPMTLTPPRPSRPSLPLLLPSLSLLAPKFVFPPLCFQSFAHSSALMRGGRQTCQPRGLLSLPVAQPFLAVRLCETRIIMAPSSTFCFPHSLSSFLSHSCELLCARHTFNPFIFKRFHTPREKHPGGGYPLPPSTPAIPSIVPLPTFKSPARLSISAPVTICQQPVTPHHSCDTLNLWVFCGGFHAGLEPINR